MKGSEKVANGPETAAQTGAGEAAQQVDATIDQVRDLLFGGAQRSIETRLADLREEAKSSLAALEAKFAKELASMQEKLRQLERVTEEKRLASQREIGAAISKLGESISGLGADPSGS